MRLIFAAVFFLVLTTASAQLAGTEWIKIKEERKDGSKTLRDNGFKFLAFTRDSVSSTKFRKGYKYTLNGSFLKLGNYNGFIIETITPYVLVITESLPATFPDDKITRFFYLNRHILFSYLMEKNKVEISPDSLVLCNDLFRPIYRGEATEMFKRYEQATKTRDITGYMILDSDGTVENIRLNDPTGFSVRELDHFITILKSTSGDWELPAVRKTLKFKADFHFQQMFKTSFRTIKYGYSFSLSHDGPMEDQFALWEKNAIKAHFDRGVRLAQKKQYDLALEQFSKTIEIDSLHLDAWYNKAFAHFKYQDKPSACKTWKKLMEWGQKPAEKLFAQNCK